LIVTSPPPLPGSIWVVAWASVAGQLAVLVPAGVRDADVSMVGSVLLSVLVIGWVSAGVVRARPVRLVVASQRTRPPVHEGASVVPLVAVAALVGVLGGLIDPDGRLPDNRVEVDVRVAGHR
jgi:hypothetical protein